MTTDITALRTLSLQRVKEIANGDSMLMGERVDLANTALRFHKELGVAVDAFKNAATELFSAQDQLEAERQRADKWEYLYNSACRESLNKDQRIAEAAEARVKELEEQNQRAGDFRRNETISALQRAEAAESRNGVLEGIIARKEFDAPKGEQVPVGKFVFEPSGERWHHIKHGEHQHAEPKLKLVKLFTAPQKPVVLPTLDEFYETSNRCVLRRNIIKAIEAAGIVVKDGE